MPSQHKRSPTWEILGDIPGLSEWDMKCAQADVCQEVKADTLIGKRFEG
jgi:hypothetical protein